MKCTIWREKPIGLERRLGMALGCVLLACCGTPIDLEPRETAMPGISTGPEPTALHGPGNKPLPPLDVEIAAEQADLRVGEPFTVRLTFTPRAGAPFAISSFETGGIVAPMDAPALVQRWQDVPADRAVQVRGEFCVTGRGEGEIISTVAVTDGAGQEIYRRSTVLYILAIGDVILTGTSSPLLLHLDYLEHQLRAGRITQQEYERTRARLLGGGATGGVTTTPGPGPTMSLDHCRTR
jgi:hypothetical protein